MTAPNETRRIKVAELHGTGLRDTRIAEILGISRERVRQIRAKLGLPAIAPQTRCPSCGQWKRSDAKQCRRCHLAGVPRITFTCEVCGLVRTIRARSHSLGRFCSHACFRARGSKAKMSRITCIFCGREVERPASWGPGLFCSRLCRGKAVGSGGYRRDGSGWMQR